MNFLTSSVRYILISMSGFILLKISMTWLRSDHDPSPQYCVKTQWRGKKKFGVNIFDGDDAKFYL